MAIVTDGWCQSELRHVPELTSSGSVQRRGAIQKCAGLTDLMFDNKLDVMAVSETWIGESAPDSVKYRLAPTGYNISHVHRSVVAGGPTRGGGGLTIIAADEIVVRDHKLQTTTCPAWFELQLVNLRAGNQVIMIAKIYRPPSNLKSTFLIELSNILWSFCLQPGNCLLLCSDFNLLGQRERWSRRQRLLVVLIQFSMEQHTMPSAPITKCP